MVYSLKERRAWVAICIVMVTHEVKKVDDTVGRMSELTHTHTHTHTLCTKIIQGPEFSAIMVLKHNHENGIIIYRKLNSLYQLNFNNKCKFSQIT